MLRRFMSWKAKRSALAHAKQQQTMVDVISANGMKAHRYFPSVGHRDNVELCTALDWFASHGFIMTDNKGNIVGKVATLNMNKNELAELRRSHMTLVQSTPGSDEKS